MLLQLDYVNSREVAPEILDFAESSHVINTIALDNEARLSVLTLPSRFPSALDERTLAVQLVLTPVRFLTVLATVLS